MSGFVSGTAREVCQTSKYTDEYIGYGAADSASERRAPIRARVSVRPHALRPTPSHGSAVSAIRRGTVRRVNRPGCSPESLSSCQASGVATVAWGVARTANGATAVWAYALRIR